VSSAGSALGTGGMSTKIVAARLATSAGVTTVITRSSNPGNIIRIIKHVHGDAADNLPQTPSTPGAVSSPSSAPAAVGAPPKHTRFLPSSEPIRDRHFWLLHGLKPHGVLYIDRGAYQALLGKAGLLPAGVVDVEGAFAQQEAVRLVVVERRHTHAGEGEKDYDPASAEEVGRALVNYSAGEILRIKGHRSNDVRGLLGYADSEYVAQRDSVSFYRRDSRPSSPMRVLSRAE
jgi:glutamate 5-kinase